VAVTTEPIVTVPVRPKLIGLPALYRIVVLSFLGTGIGVAVSLCALGFVEAVFWLNDLLLVSPRARILREEDPLLVASATVLVPAIGGLVVGLILQHLVTEKRPLGPPDTILLVQTQAAPASARSGLMSTLAAIVSLGSGASVGQYGPMVYLGTLVGAAVTRLRLDIPNIQAISIASGVAAAISTAFNAPIAGLVFAHEVILRHYSIQAFAPTTVAAAAGYVVANVVFERPPLFLVEFDGVEHGYEFVLFAVIGVLCAVLALIYMKAILACAAFAGRSRLPPALRPMAAGLVLGLVALELPEVLGIGKETLRFATIESAFGTGELTLILIAKMAVTVLCLGFGFAGGVFSPSLLIGILFGALLAGILDDLTSIEHSGVVPYAICGMMALTSPVIGAPLATILIVFELTRSYDLTIAAMVSVVFANLISYRIFGRSLFDVQLMRRGFDLSFGRGSAILAGRRITELMHDDYPRFSSDDRIEDVLRQLGEGGRAEGLVVDRTGAYVGVVRAQACIAKQPSASVTDALDSTALEFDDTTSIWQAMEAFRQFRGELAPVVSASDRRLLGVVSESSVIDAYLETVNRLRREENESV
jgi:CIC family chloride channel protein